MKKEHPKTVKAKEKARIIIPGNKLTVLKVNHEKLTIKIQERHKSIILLGNFRYFEEKRVNPNTIKLMFNENIMCCIIE
ncbi:MAG: hypothetical protein ACFFCL_09325 [Promethearchaeota archaeon]